MSRKDDRRLALIFKGTQRLRVSALVIAFFIAAGQGQTSSLGQGLYGNLSSQPTFREEDYLGAQQERGRYTRAADFVYDFPNKEGIEVIGKGGNSLQVELSNKPSLVRSNALSQTMFTLSPCGLNIPHMHPRAGKVLHVLKGIVSVGFVEEGMVATSRVISQNLTAGQSFVIPEGLAMWVHNLNCEEAQYLDTWSSPDPGILNLVPALMKMPLPTLAAALNVDTATAAFLAARSRSPIEQGPAECLALCNLTIQQSPAGAPLNSQSLSPADSPQGLPQSTVQIATLTAGPTTISVLTAPTPTG